MIVTKTLFSIPALITFVPASINHLYSICVPRQCIALMPCMLLHSGDVQCCVWIKVKVESTPASSSVLFVLTSWSFSLHL